MGKDLGLDTSTMNIAVAITALFSGIFIVVMGGLAGRVGRVKIVRIGFYLSILCSLLVGFSPTGYVRLHTLGINDHVVLVPASSWTADKAKPQLIVKIEPPRCK